ncbi:TATA-box-binding protein-like [Folsomia candida]|uniref:TATA-box-binding protein-like n=1 Tax=Folsomia candida TaxID=158441 RepID=UPI0016055B0B|nr:TATA-box-binding protein-like [Folsomia candida]
MSQVSCHAICHDNGPLLKSVLSTLKPTAFSEMGRVLFIPSMNLLRSTTSSFPSRTGSRMLRGSKAQLKEGLEPTVLSVAASVNLGADLDLKAIADACVNLSYNPESFAPLVMRLKDPIATAMVHRGGRMTVAGAKSVEDCKIAVRKFTAMVRSVGFNVRPFGMLIKNISATFSVGFKIRLRDLSKNRMLTPQITYEPDSFTGVSMALPFPKANVMVFRTGSGMIQGVTTFKDLDKVFKIIYPHFKMYAM